MYSNKISSRVLVVDDSPINTEILEKLLKKEYDVAIASSGEECLEILPVFNPDLVLLDIMMPGIDGYEVCRRIKNSPVGNFTQVILISGKALTEERLKGYEVGADDYVVKPFDHDELLAKVKIHFRLRETMTELWTANAKIQRFNHELENLANTRSTEIVATRDLAIFALAKLAESRDPDTGEHLDRMRNYSRILAEQLSVEGPYTSMIDQKVIDDIFRSSPLHDIGKVGIPDAVLLKPGRLTKDEFKIMKRHSIIGAEALQQAIKQSDCGGFLEMAIDIAKYHHEKFDGTGYPSGLAGDDIPLAARIVALADVFDALTSVRVYKKAFDPEKARNIIEEGSGKHFDPAVVDAFRVRYDDFLTLMATHQQQGQLELVAGSSFS